MTRSAATTAELNVLLVDDQPIIAHGVRQLLGSEKDIVLHYCQYPREAFGKAREVNATLILQDLTMPEIDGITLVRFFRNHPATKTVPIIILSGKDTPRDKVDGFKAGATDYLVKLPEKTEFIARIRAHVAAYRREQAMAEERQALRLQVDEVAAELERLHSEVARLNAELQVAQEAAEIAAAAVGEEPIPVDEMIGDLTGIGSHRDTAIRRDHPTPNSIAEPIPVGRPPRHRSSTSTRAPQVPDMVDEHTA
ncbi:MAG: response regulator [Planctomycetota bacterium]